MAAYVLLSMFVVNNRGESRVEMTSRSQHPCLREVRDGVRTSMDVRTRMYVVVTMVHIDVRTVPVRTTVVTSYRLDLDPRS
jgi:hypothetical protein